MARPVPAQQYRGRVDPSPVRNGARVRARRRARSRQLPQHGHSSDGSRYSVTHREIRTSQTCAHFEPAASAPARLVPYPEHCAGGSAAFRSSGSRSRDRSAPGCPSCPPRLRSMCRSRSEVSRSRRPAFAALFAPISSFELGVPELLLSIPSRLSSSAIRSSSRRSRSAADDNSARSTLTSVSSLPPQAAARSTAHDAPRYRQADRAHRTQATSLFNLNCNLKHPLRRVSAAPLPPIRAAFPTSRYRDELPTQSY
jgi:hypothetical protein